MAATRRIMKEVEELKKSSIKEYVSIQVDDKNILCWICHLSPTTKPFDKYKFEVEVLFPVEYPFKPPKILFKTKIYHPNIDEKGQLCMPIILSENWKPATKAEHILQALLALVNDPQIEHAIRTDVAEEYDKNIEKYFKNASEHCRLFAIPK